MRGESDHLQAALDASQAASARAGVTVLPITDTSAFTEIESLLARVWMHPPGSVELDASLLTALGRTGNYVTGAYRNGMLVGATAGFRCEPFPTTLYSHVTGVDRSRAAGGTGTALKYYQRVWCLQRHIKGVRWTFDPLQSRNAGLNVHRLGAMPIEFHRDYYGQLRDGLNRQVGSDRLLVHWDLEGPETPGTDGVEPHPEAAVLSVGASGEPVLSGRTPTTRCRVAIPHDIDTLRAKDIDGARRWQDAVRMVLGDLMADNWKIIDFADSSYVLRAPDAEPDRQVQP